MEITFSRFVALLLAVGLLLFAGLPGSSVSAATPDYANIHVNTGNQREDILAVALTQVGYTEGYNHEYENDTKYGSWNRLPFQPWCASFIIWCARQAEISEDIIRRTGQASPRMMGISYYSGSYYTPQPGDFFFTAGFTHVGIVLNVEGEHFYCIEGNANSELSTDGYYVIINKRQTEHYYFGVPDYQGEGDHNYIRCVESGHPHKVYYKCQDCGDKYYNGFTEIEAGCRSCLSCGCSETGAGYYRTVIDEQNIIRIRDGHSYGSEEVGGIPNNAVVYVYGFSGDWAYVEYDRIRGHVRREYLEEYYPAPAEPVVTADREGYIRGDTVTLTVGETMHAEDYRLELFRNGEAVDDVMLDGRIYVLENAPAGEYEVRVTAANLTGWSQPGILKFTVRDTYTVTYDPRGGENPPESQTQPLGTAVTVSKTEPVREGYTFLGWTGESEGIFAQYLPGDSFFGGGDMTMYAVWKEDSATAQDLQISKLPQRTLFLVGEELDTTGLELHLTYSDGSGYPVRNGFATEGYSSEELGVKTVTVTCEGMTVSFEVEIVDFIPGDINLDKTVNRDDVMQLLWHITFPAEFPIETPADFTGDSLVNRDDVMQLLWHITFPGQFPLMMPEA